ncbi:hypothetical protein E2C01_030158 [Portunus trituberculatus]|uniref:Uncharacterized protein n=1 Tax=Portunus trituberculatus TaxID=210409 RepID=A0A5B7EUL1_PORTR|nr:hypothetical protein [Portunus trituberculatus]
MLGDPLGPQSTHGSTAPRFDRRGVACVKEEQHKRQKRRMLTLTRLDTRERVSRPHILGTLLGATRGLARASMARPARCWAQNRPPHRHSYVLDTPRRREHFSQRGLRRFLRRLGVTGGSTAGGSAILPLLGRDAPPPPWLCMRPLRASRCSREPEGGVAPRVRSDAKDTDTELLLWVRGGGPIPVKLWDRLRGGRPVPARGLPCSLDCRESPRDGSKMEHSSRRRSSVSRSMMRSPKASGRVPGRRSSTSGEVLGRRPAVWRTGRSSSWLWEWLRRSLS